MGRRNETNRLAHKKKADQKKQKIKSAEALRKEKRNQILKNFNKNNNSDPT